MDTDKISQDYRRLQTELHRDPTYGVSSLTFAPAVADLIRQTNVRSVCDYGAGKKNLLVGLNKAGITPQDYFPYDPVFPDYGPPRPAELVCCIDVLEHIELDKLDNVLGELKSLVTRLGFLTIHMGPAEKVMADGRNAHLIQEPSSWWLPRICRYFEVLQLQCMPLEGQHIWMIVGKKAD